MATFTTAKATAAPITIHAVAGSKRPISPRRPSSE
jgi:hypothetical protein